MATVPCKFFAQGRCTKGEECTFLHGPAKGGKGKAKGKGEGGKGHMLPRTRISAEKFGGTIVSWKGKYGWIEPGEEIQHEKASLRNGNLFFGKDDLIDIDFPAEGTPVLFHICEDDSGLGAEEVEATGPPPKGKGKGKGKSSAPSWGAGKAAGKAVNSWGSSWQSQKTSSVPAAFAGKGKGGVKGWSSDKGADKGKGKGKAKGKFDENKGKGHLLPRTRITAEKFEGIVAAWKGKYGWVTPNEEIPHEKANAHRGGIFVSKDDLVDIEELTPGATVEFHIWEDSSGLGGEEVVQL
mmetsp:Transcript_974/g.1248  ORF Transcript_974/g.1248 Transcript_974/m.1248 type:complete len:295 (-) Transcript_974:43-927(-)